MLMLVMRYNWPPKDAKFQGCRQYWFGTSKGANKFKACAKSLAGSSGMRQYTPRHSPPVLDALSTSSLSLSLSPPFVFLSLLPSPLKNSTS